MIKRLLTVSVLAGATAACTLTMFRHDSYDTVDVRQTVGDSEITRPVRISWIWIGDDDVDLTASPQPDEDAPTPPLLTGDVAQQAVEKLLPELCGDDNFQAGHAPVGYPGQDYAFRYHCGKAP